MSILVGDNFSYSAAKPLDARLKYSTLADMKAVGDATMYDGCMAYCVATDKTYQWKSTNSVDASTGRWREFSSGGGSSATVMVQTLTAGSTTVTFTNIPTTGSNLIDFFTSTGINYTAINTATAGQVTLTFEEQAVDVTVYCEIKEVS